MADDAVRYIDAITERYRGLGYADYRWYRADEPAPWHPLAKPIGRSRLGVLTTSGAYVVGQVAYFYKDDTSIRAIPKDTPSERIHFSHITQNYLENPRKDPNCIVPLHALLELESRDEVGAVADELFSCMGGIYSQRRVREELIPELRTRFTKQAVDTVLLVPM